MPCGRGMAQWQDTSRAINGSATGRARRQGRSADSCLAHAGQLHQGVCARTQSRTHIRTCIHKPFGKLTGLTDWGCRFDDGFPVHTQVPKF